MSEKFKLIAHKILQILEMYNNNQSGTDKKRNAGGSEHQHTLADELIQSERFAQIIGAIIAGKYSWACVLLLTWANYKPLHYIPFRTYKRLLKENVENNKDVMKEKSRCT